MEVDLRKLEVKMEEITNIFSKFMAGFTKFEQLVLSKKGLLSGFQQGLEFYQRPPLEKSSKLVERILKVNETDRIKAYMKACYGNPDDRVENGIKLHGYHCGLQSHIKEASLVLEELEGLMEEVLKTGLDAHRDDDDFREESMLRTSCSNPSVEEDPLLLMAIIYPMVKQDFQMQEKIVNRINLNTSSEEMSSYVMMWSLRPYIVYEALSRAWKLIA